MYEHPRLLEPGTAGGDALVIRRLRGRLRRVGRSGTPGWRAAREAPLRRARPGTGQTARPVTPARSSHASSTPTAPTTRSTVPAARSDSPAAASASASTIIASGSRRCGLLDRVPSSACRAAAGRPCRHSASARRTRSASDSSVTPAPSDSSHARRRRTVPSASGASPASSCARASASSSRTRSMTCRSGSGSGSPTCCGGSSASALRQCDERSVAARVVRLVREALRRRVMTGSRARTACANGTGRGRRCGPRAGSGTARPRGGGRRR